MSKASNFINDIGHHDMGACDIASSLDARGIPSDQDWDAETTVWTFADGSKIVISGPNVTVLEP